MPTRHPLRSLVLAFVVGLGARPATASVLAYSLSVSGDSIARGFDANTSSCNYGDNVSRSFATGDDHGTNFCAPGGTTYSHAERLDCAASVAITNFNDAASGATMRGDFASQAATIKLHLSSSTPPRYVPVFMGHNDACTNTTSKTGNSCGGDQDPNNYCRTTNAAFEREFRRGMDQLIQIPSVRIAVLATVRASELCNFGSKSACGLGGLGESCQTLWKTLDIVFGSGGVCASMTTDCSDQRRIDMYETLVAYNAILERVTAEYAAIPTGGSSATGAVKAPDVQLKYLKSPFYYQFGSSDVSCCDCFHPDDQGQAKLAEATWSGVQCGATVPCCATSGDPLTDAKCAQVDTTSTYPGGFWASGPCGNGILDPGEQCDDGNAADGDCCSSTCQFEAPGAACGDDGNVCTNDVCDGAGVCTHPANTRSCDDGNGCTTNDVCVNGTCTGGPPVVCTAQDQCHTAGTCNPQTGSCTNPTRPNGTPCDDGNACTQTDTCQLGFCAGANPVVCSASDQCHAAGTCNPSTGVCSNPARPDGTACNDGNACTRQDACVSGLCTGADPVTCTASDQCHVAGTCNPSTGACSNPAAPDGTACNDGSLCTAADACHAGTCGGTPVSCTPLDACHAAGTCDPSTGVCSNPAKPDGGACDDGNPCTSGDACHGGTCAGTPVACSAQDQCHTAGVCNPTSGACTSPAKPDGSACDDGNACTQTDACQSGVCTGTNPVQCPPADQCHQPGVCAPATGTCSTAPRPDGTACDDGDACTRADACHAGVCGGTSTACGDGVVQAGCGEACDDGDANGVDGCCTADCHVVDADGDGLCDRDDPCSGGSPVAKPKLTITRQSTPPGDDGLKLVAQLGLPPSAMAALNPTATGLRIVVADATGHVAVDATIPAGAWDFATRTGWTLNGAATAWVWKSGLGGVDGIVRANVKKLRTGGVQVSITGKKGRYPVPATALPVDATLSFDPDAACGSVRFSGPPPAPACAFSASGTLKCR